MTYLAAVTVATLLLVAFLVINAFGLIVKELQHKRHMRERGEMLVQINGSLEGMFQALKVKGELAALVAAGQRLDASMGRSIAEGIDLAQLLALRNQELADLVELRGAQKAEEQSTLDVWVKVRDDLTAFADRYPPYLWTQDEGAKS